MNRITGQASDQPTPVLGRTDQTGYDIAEHLTPPLDRQDSSTSKSTPEDGRNLNTANHMRRALGRTPRDFSTSVPETAATRVWSVTA
jgi:hypothetical protein